jgi:hypothetical protein
LDTSRGDRLLRPDSTNTPKSHWTSESPVFAGES